MAEMAAKAKAAASRFHAWLRARHASDGCDTWERLTYEHRNVVDGKPVEGWGCREHGLFTTAEA